MSHTRAVGEDRNAILRFDVGLRDNWVDKNRTFTAATGKVVYARKLNDTLRLITQASAEKRFYTDGSDALVGNATAALTYTFAGGSELSGLISYTNYQAQTFIFDSQSWVGRLTYHFGEPVLDGVELSASWAPATRITPTTR